jgi:hypothetical protein
MHAYGKTLRFATRIWPDFLIEAESKCLWVLLRKVGHTKAAPSKLVLPTRLLQPHNCRAVNVCSVFNANSVLTTEGLQNLNRTRQKSVVVLQ